MKIIPTLLLFLIFLPFVAKANSFFEERYRGWLWFEENQANTAEEEYLDLDSKKITPEEARAEIESLKQELDDLRFVMMARPTPENVRNYRKKEQEMWSQALKLHDAWEMANLMYPEQQDLINNPVNVHAVKMKREKDREIRNEQIKELAKKFDLVLFFQKDCGYCQTFSPVLKNFGDKYGFNIEAISMDGTSSHEIFKTRSVPELVARLGIEAAPTVIAVSHDSKIAFELIRGYVTLSELEEHSSLAIKYLKSEGKW